MSENLPITWEELQKALECPREGANTARVRFIAESSEGNTSALKWPDFDVRAEIRHTLSDTAIFGLTTAADHDKDVIRQVYHEVITVILSSQEGNDWLCEALDEMKKGKIVLARYKVKQCVSLILHEAKKSGEFILRSAVGLWEKKYPVLQEIAIPTTDEMYLPMSYSENISESVTEEKLKNSVTLRKHITETIKQSLETGPISLLAKVQSAIKNI